MTKKKTKAAAASVCPCGTPNAQGQMGDLADCCGPYLSGARLPENAAVLMRTRYTAYVLGDMNYVAATWHPRTRPALLSVEAPPLKWLGLTVLSHAQQDDHHATVAFVARYKDNGRAGAMNETSRFECVNGQWLYVDGDVA